MFIIFEVIFAISLLFCCKKYLYVFQQNGYKRNNFLLNLSCIKWYIFADFSSIIFQFFALFYFYSYAFLLLLSLQNYVLAFLFSPKKIPLKITKRVLRLGVILMIFLLIFVLFLPPNCLFFTQIFLLFIFVSASIFAQPMENFFKARYLKRAKVKLNSLKNLKIIAIGGSFGKTTTKQILFHLLKEDFRCVATPKNFNTELGVAMTILQNVDEKTEIFICEMGAKRQKDLQNICKICKPNYSIICGISLCHVAEFGSLEKLKLAKFELVENTKELCIFNVDGEGKSLFDWAKNCKSTANLQKISVGTKSCDNFKTGQTSTENSKNCDFDYQIELQTDNEFCIDFGGQKHMFQTSLCGDHIKKNSALAIAMAKHLRLDLHNIKCRLKTLPQIENRLQVTHKNEITILDNSYNSNPESAKNSLKLLSTYSGRKIAVICGMVELGKYQFEENKKLGELCKSVCDYVFVVGKTNRKAILCGLQNYENAVCFANLDAVVKYLPSFLQKDDCILFENDLPDNYL